VRRLGCAKKVIFCQEIERVRNFLLPVFGLMPAGAFAAAGGVGEGFGADDWLSKWPVLAVVLALVLCTTGFLTVQIRRRARAMGDEG
jgi:hypothetical protein